MAGKFVQGSLAALNPLIRQATGAGIAGALAGGDQFPDITPDTPDSEVFTQSGLLGLLNKQLKSGGVDMKTKPGPIVIPTGTQIDTSEGRFSAPVSVPQDPEEIARNERRQRISGALSSLGFPLAQGVDPLAEEAIAADLNRVVLREEQIEQEIQDGVHDDIPDPDRPSIVVQGFQSIVKSLSPFDLLLFISNFNKIFDPAGGDGINPPIPIIPIPYDDLPPEKQKQYDQEVERGKDMKPNCRQFIHFDQNGNITSKIFCEQAVIEE